MAWDLFCRVIDNFGDVGVCWRLACGLATRGIPVRLWIDDPTALGWMAPAGHAGVHVMAFDAAEQAEAGAVVVEAFGCDPPPGFVARMARRAATPVWINLEYLSAEAYVEGSHGLQSPQLSGPGAGLSKWFFYPGFTPGTGGLLRGAPAPEDRATWLAAHGWAARGQERVVLLFCYDNPQLPALLDSLAQRPTLMLAAQGAAQRGLAKLTQPSHVRTIALPWLPQAQFDQLLHCTDLNLVRGEDSLAQAQWPGLPFVWQIYPQADGAHAAKLDAFLDRFIARTNFADATALRALWRAWNGLGPWPAALPAAPAWRQATQAWRDSLCSEPDLIEQLLHFAAQRP